jgi:hypothetical protein
MNDRLRIFPAQYKPCARRTMWQFMAAGPGCRQQSSFLSRLTFSGVPLCAGRLIKNVTSYDRTEGTACPLILTSIITMKALTRLQRSLLHLSLRLLPRGRQGGG